MRDLQELKRAFPNQIVLPRGVENPVLLLLVAENKNTAEDLKTRFLDLGYGVVGPVQSTDSAHSLARKIPLDGFAYLIGNDLSEILSFFHLLEEFPLLPVIFLGQLDATVKVKMKKLENPNVHHGFPIQDTSSFLLSLSRLFGDRGGEMPELLLFANATFRELIELSLRRDRSEVAKILTDELGQLPSRMEGFSFTKDPYPTLIYISPKKFDRSQFFVMLELLFSDLEETINTKLEVDWGADFINDAILQAIAKHKFKDNLVLDFARSRGLPDLNIKKMLDRVTVKERNIAVGYIELSDHGPELMKMKADPGLETFINDQTVAQLISIVGQGESYREGQFGVVPLLQSHEYVSILTSKMLDSDTLKDIRMAGRSLTLIFVVLHKSFSNLAMDKSFLKEAMAEYNSISDVSQVTDEMIERIYEKFKFILPSSS
ncbi:MAG: hypothetical protein D6732_03780 [Methanobacteriota archaeon]|nr:MAG: hypothetical protein D6732_03780 [Euryarchaeota archaeon]